MRIEFFWQDLKGYFLDMQGVIPVILISMGVTIILHLSFKKPRLWPAIAAFSLYLLSFLMLFIWNKLSATILSLLLGGILLGFALAWFIIDLILRHSK